MADLFRKGSDFYSELLFGYLALNGNFKQKPIGLGGQQTYVEPNIQTIHCTDVGGPKTSGREGASL